MTLVSAGISHPSMALPPEDVSNHSTLYENPPRDGITLLASSSRVLDSIQCHVHRVAVCSPGTRSWPKIQRPLSVSRDSMFLSSLLLPWF